MNADAVETALVRIADTLVARVRAAMPGRSPGDLAAVVREEDDDAIFLVDRIAEERLAELVEQELDGQGRIRLTAEGGEKDLVIDCGGEGAWHVIVDPVDGSRLLAWDKRSAFTLVAAAPDLDGAETLEDIAVAVMAEIPCSRSPLSDLLVARRGGGVRGKTRDLITGASRDFEPGSSRRTEPRNGFGSILRFFAPGRELLARIDDELARALHGDEGRPLLFEDPYLSTGGIMHQLATGRDLFAADLRPRLATLLEARGEQAPLCSHPYDLCTLLVAREAGAIVVSETGGRLESPLDRFSRCGFIAYANDAIRARIEEPLLRIAEEVLSPRS